MPTLHLLSTVAQSCTSVFSPAGLKRVSRIKLVSKHLQFIHVHLIKHVQISSFSFSPLSHIRNHLLDHQDSVQLDFLHNCEPKAPNSAWLAASPLPYYNLLSRLITYSSFHPRLGSLWPISTSSTRPLSLKKQASYYFAPPKKKQVKKHSSSRKLWDFCRLLHQCCVKAQTFTEIFIIQEFPRVLSL